MALRKILSWSSIYTDSGFPYFVLSMALLLRDYNDRKAGPKKKLYPQISDFCF